MTPLGCHLEQRESIVERQRFSLALALEFEIVARSRWFRGRTCDALVVLVCMLLSRHVGAQHR
jgi:hypothetical protein